MARRASHKTLTADADLSQDAKLVHHRSKGGLDELTVVASALNMLTAGKSRTDQALYSSKAIDQHLIIIV